MSAGALWTLVWAYARAVALREALDPVYHEYAATLAEELERELADVVVRLKAEAA